MALLTFARHDAVRGRGDRRAPAGWPLPAGRCGKLSAMNLALRKPMTMPEFFEWGSRHEFRYEFDGSQPVAMTGGTRAHPTIQRNLAVSLTDRLRGKPGNFLGSDLKIEAAGRICYPDGFVVCSPGPNTSTVVADPIVVFEILGPSTLSTDRIAKHEDYRATPSIQRYVILEQDRIADPWRRPGRQSRVSKLITQNSSPMRHTKPTLKQPSLKPRAGFPNCNLPSLFDDIILGHEI
jgi:Uma2 family endonuclease